MDIFPGDEKEAAVVFVVPAVLWEHAPMLDMFDLDIWGDLPVPMCATSAGAAVLRAPHCVPVHLQSHGHPLPHALVELGAWFTT